MGGLKAGLDRIQQVGGAGPGDRTMIDALFPALEGLSNGLDVAALAAREGADSTAKIPRVRAGRASYLSEENLAGHNDPGAEAVARLFEKITIVPDRNLEATKAPVTSRPKSTHASCVGDVRNGGKAAFKPDRVSMLIFLQREISYVYRAGGYRPE
ncbi:MAG: DAK2 domain-containing protein [Cohaesibacteraceae bacterium]